MTSNTRKHHVISLVAALALASCKGAEQVQCQPTDPLCNPGGGAAVSTVTVTSAIDTVMAVGRTAQMSAVARDASNNTVSVTFSWTSSNAPVATANTSSGLFSASAAGTFNAVAAQTNNSVTGQLGMRVVNADLPGGQSALADPFMTALRGALSATPQSTINSALTTCAGHFTSGNLLALRTCLNGIIAVSGGTNGNDNALLAVIDLFAEHARRRLNL